MFRKRIGVYPSSQLLQRERLWHILGQIMPVLFEPCSELREFQGDALLTFDEKQTRSLTHLKGIPCLAYVDDERPKVDCGSGPIEFGSLPWLHAYFRAQMIADSSVTVASSLNAEPGDMIVATKGDQTLWLRRNVGDSVVDLVTVSPPVLQRDSYLFEHFQDTSFFSLLPLLHFLRSIALGPNWIAPPPRACLMFDDANLHGTRYGYINYPGLAHHAEKHNYHVSFATIPLDAWLVSGSAARLFRSYSTRFSLLIHGNDHLKRELALNYSRNERVKLLVQALQRIHSLEQRSGLDVCRVMAAPHGACTEPMMREMARVGFEAACISYGSLRAHNRNASWTRDLGLRMTENIGSLPVVPRSNLAKANRTRTLLSAFLDQPIVLSGHHTDLKGGLEHLEQCARWINSFKGAQWLSMKAILRSNYYMCRDKGTLHLVMYTNSARVSIPGDIRSLRVANGFASEPVYDNCTWKVLEAETKAVSQTNEGELIPVKPGSEVEVVRACQDPVNPALVPLPHPKLWPIMRRVLTECRDRLLPLKSRLRGMKA